MRKNQTLEHGKEAWSFLEKIYAKTGRDLARIFHDWLDLMLVSFLSATAKGAGQLTLHEAYEQQYLSILSSYTDKAPIGQRSADYFAKALGALVGEMTVKERDVLGDLYLARITSTERGQFFTPEPITQMMIQMMQPLDGESIADPACGSGRMLLEAHKTDPSAFLYGKDIDEQCAKMCAINLFLFGCRAVVEWGNSLSMETWKRWEIGRVFIFERKPEDISITPTQLHRIEDFSSEETATNDQLSFDLFKQGEG